ncbi:MAG: hypothetical protein KGL10_04860 [Alphaproteobacteria bacterium]|nr:hypothetical protein [Alphaproteobacteria bacterium]MDE2336621.1 hypothetical protein [Alphaproteobacteria bacterium]
MRKKTSAPQNAAGNILLYVLIGIALFAAFMFMITRGDQGSIDTSERAAMDAQQITSYAQKVYGAVQSVMLQNDCRASQVDFTNSQISGYNGSGIAKCQVFGIDGGGMEKMASPPAEAVDTAAAAAAGSGLAGSYIFEGNVCVNNAGTGPTDNGAGPACDSTHSEIIMIMPWVTQEVCAQIDQITMNTTTIPTVSANTFDGTKFTGTLAGTYTIATGSKTYAAGCFESTGQTSPPGTGYHFYEVLEAQ